MSMDSDKECPLDSPFSTRRGFVKFGIEVSLEGTSAVEVPVNPFYATLYDAGEEIDPADRPFCSLAGYTRLRFSLVLVRWIAAGPQGSVEESPGSTGQGAG